MTVRRMRIAYCIPKATDPHSKYVTLIAFPKQQWLYKRPSLLHYTYIAPILCLEYPIYCVLSDMKCSLLCCAVY